MENKEQMKHPKGLLLANITTGLQSFYAYGIVGFIILSQNHVLSQDRFLQD